MRLSQALKRMEVPLRQKLLQQIALQSNQLQIADPAVVQYAEAFFLAEGEGESVALPDQESAASAARIFDALARAAYAAGEVPGSVFVKGLAFSLQPTIERLRVLSGLCNQGRLHEDACQVLEAWLERETDAGRRRELYSSLLELLEGTLRDYPRAALWYATAYAELGGVERLRGQARCLEAAKQYRQLVDVTRRQLEVELEPAQRAVLHVRLASLSESLDGDENAARAHYRQALSLRVGFAPAVQGLLAIGERRQDYPSVAEALSSALLVETRPKERATILTRLGSLSERELNDRESAKRYFERAIRQYPKGLNARLRLLELLCEAGAFEEAERVATLPPSQDGTGLSGAELARLARFRARVAQERGRPEEALASLALGIEVAPDPEPFLEELIALVRRERLEASPPEVLMRLIREPATSPATLAKARRASGVIHWLAGRPELAKADLVAAQAIARSAEGAWALADYYLSLRRPQEAVDALLDPGNAGLPEAEALARRAQRIRATFLGGELSPPQDEGAADRGEPERRAGQLIALGRKAEALELYRAAFQTGGLERMDCLEGLMALAPETAEDLITGSLERLVWDPRGLRLVAGLPSLSNCQRRVAQALLAAVTGERPQGGSMDWGRFWGVDGPPDPAFLLIRELRERVPAAFRAREAAILATAQPVRLQGPILEQLEEGCRTGGLPAVQLFVHAQAAVFPTVLSEPHAVVIAAALLRDDVPDAALLFALSRGLWVARERLQPLTYLPAYQLEILVDTLFEKQRTDGDASLPELVEHLGDALEVPAGEHAGLLQALLAVPLPGGVRPSALRLRNFLESCTARAAYRGQQDLSAALCALTAHPLPQRALRATGGHWLRSVGRSPQARTLLREAMQPEEMTSSGPPG